MEGGWREDPGARSVAGGEAFALWASQRVSGVRERVEGAGRAAECRECVQLCLRFACG